MILRFVPALGGISGINISDQQVNSAEPVCVALHELRKFSMKNIRLVNKMRCDIKFIIKLSNAHTLIHIHTLYTHQMMASTWLGDHQGISSALIIRPSNVDMRRAINKGVFL